MCLNPGCPGTTAVVLICLEYVETAASFLKMISRIVLWAIFLIVIVLQSLERCFFALSTV